MVTIVVPALATPGLIWVIWGGRQTDDEVSPMMKVKDGQLGWVTMALAASAALEVPPTWWLMYLGFGLAFLVSAIWAIVGVTTPQLYPFPDRGYGRLWRRTLSLYLIVGLAFAFVHFFTYFSRLAADVSSFIQSWHFFTR